MPSSALSSFRAALNSVVRSMPTPASRLVRDDSLKERCRNLLRAWAGNVSPAIQNEVKDRSGLLKVRAELEVLAQLAAKQKPAKDYLFRLHRVVGLLDALVIVVPRAGGALVPAKKRRFKERFSDSIPDLPLSLVPNGILGWQGAMEAFLQRYPFDTSVFVMIRYRRRNDALIREVKSALKRQGLHAIIASDHDLTDDLYNPIACLLCCARGLAVFDRAEETETFNPNVAYELGMLHLLRRECLILKHSSLKTLQTDILMKLYKQYERAADAAALVDQWAKKIQGLATGE